MRKIFYLLIVLFVGCSQAPLLKMYGLEVPSLKQKGGGSMRNKTLKVTYPQSLLENINEKINFSYSSSDEGVYQNSQWSKSLGKLLQGTLIEILTQSQQFKAVIADTSSAKENYRLESSIFAFHHRIRGEVSESIISIEFSLIDMEKGGLVKSRRFRYAEPTLTKDAQGYVSATNRAIAKMSQDLRLWLK